MKDQNDDFIALKWGTLKAWKLENSPESFEILRQWSELGVSFGAMTQDDTPEQKELICKLIDSFDGPIQNRWTGEDFASKEDAKKYVMEYGKEKA